MTQQKTEKNTIHINFLCGLFTGVFCSGLFNPWDRALYLSIKNNRPFLLLDNFKQPYQGFSQAVFQRAFLGSIYFILQGELKTHLYPHLRHNIGINEPISQFSIGLVAGSFSGILTNSISAIKYHTWGKENRTFFSSVSEMWTLGGYKAFLKGTTPTVGRDMVFGSTYESLRYLLNKQGAKYKANNSYIEHGSNLFAAGFATVLSGPLNYVRNMQYATPPDQKPPSIPNALRTVWNESKSQSNGALTRLSFFQRRFGIGWGTARVAVGMAVGQKVFDFSREQLSNSS